jgi:cytochrome c553
MKTNLFRGAAIAFASLSVASMALAQNSGASAPSASTPPAAPAGANAQPPAGSAGGAAAGAQIASNGINNGGNAVAACASCHGAKGEGNAAAGFPRLAGQSQWYLAKQLANYANGSRNHPVMTPIAKGLTAAQMGDVASFYASVDAPAVKAAASATPAPSAAAIRRGETLAGIGDDRLAVQSCANCHGPGGVGEQPAYPYLAGQHASYLSGTLTSWKNGTRNTDPSQQMPTIAKRLSETDIAAVAAYYAQLRAPSPAELQPNLAAGTLARPVPTVPVRSGPSGQSVPAQGVGSEQGSPTQGGSQGIGGGGAASGSGPQGSPSGAGTMAPGAGSAPQPGAPGGASGTPPKRP